MGRKSKKNNAYTYIYPQLHDEYNKYILKAFSDLDTLRTDIAKNFHYALMVIDFAQEYNWTNEKIHEQINCDYFANLAGPVFEKIAYYVKGGYEYVSWALENTELKDQEHLSYLTQTLEEVKVRNKTFDAELATANQK